MERTVQKVGCEKSPTEALKGRLSLWSSLLLEKGLLQGLVCPFHDGLPRRAVGNPRGVLHAPLLQELLKFCRYIRRSVFRFDFPWHSDDGKCHQEMSYDDIFSFFTCVH